MTAFTARRSTMRRWSSSGEKVRSCAGVPVGGAPAALASWLADGSSAVADEPAVLPAELGMELALASSPDSANGDKQAMMPPIAERARQAASVLLRLNM